jgi:formamidopyrimidine-DNA glycosylase
MPELPEVETVISDLNKKIKGETIVGFWSDWQKAIKGKNLEQFKKEIKNRKILNARRIGKNIFLDLSGNKTLYLHLKMTGHLLVKFPIKSKIKNPKLENKNYFNDRVNQYIHHIFYLKSGRTLEFSDMRKFAKIILDDTEKINNLKEIKSLGIDAMDEKFDFKKFQEILNKKPKNKIGMILMEQNLIAGIGNIYRSEILFDAGVNPLKIINKIKIGERKKIFHSIKKILKLAIKYRGTSDSDYRDTSGAPGNFQKIIRVYGRGNAKCRKCGIMIKRLKLGQRSLFFCPRCQK